MRPHQSNLNLRSTVIRNVEFNCFSCQILHVHNSSYWVRHMQIAKCDVWNRPKKHFCAFKWIKPNVSRRVILMDDPTILSAYVCPDELVIRRDMFPSSFPLFGALMAQSSPQRWRNCMSEQWCNFQSGDAIVNAWVAVLSSAKWETFRAEWLRCIRSKDKLGFASSHTKAKEVEKINGIAHVQPSVFRRHNFSRRVSPSWDQAFRAVT